MKPIHVLVNIILICTLLREKMYLNFQHKLEIQTNECAYQSIKYVISTQLQWHITTMW